MENLRKAGLVIYNHSGWVGNLKPCTNCGKCGKKVKINKMTEIEPLLIPGFVSRPEGFKDETMVKLLPPTGITFKT